MENDEPILGQGHEVININACNNTFQTLKRHYYINAQGNFDHDIADFILKKGDYTNTYIAIETDGIPDGVILNLLDENDNQLYSPVDTNNNWITTACSITVGETDIIPLPAQFDNQLSSHVPFSAGTYNWKLKFSGNSYYEEKELPLEIEIRDFKVWDILTPEVYPNEDIKVKLKTYADTYYPNNYFDNNLLTTNATYDASTGVITYPNQDITDLSIGKHMQVINQSNNCFIDYEVKNPISFYVAHSNEPYIHNHGEYNTATNWIGYTALTGNQSGLDSLTINGINQTINGKSYNDNMISTSLTLPPGTYYCQVGGKTTTCNAEIYICDGTFTVTTEQCTLSLTLEGDIIKTTYLYDNTTPIPNARIGLIDAHTNTLLETAVSDAQGQCIWTTTESGIYKSVAYDMRTNEIILESNIIAPLVYNVNIDNGDLIINKYDNIPDSSISVIDNIINDDEGNLLINITQYNSINDVKNAIYDIDIDENGDIYYKTIGV